VNHDTRRIAVTAALAAIILAAVFTRFYRLGEPDQCYFDEVYFPTTGAEILRGDNAAWNFIGHENTHPPLSKELMAAGMAIFGHQGSAAENHCWGDAEDAAKKGNPDWLYEPFGWRFFGALAGVGAVLFIYLIAKKLFQSEVAGLAAAFLLTFEGLAFVQSRIATPDTYVLFFLLGAVYFLLSDRLSIRRLFMSGLFLGAAVASKWTAALAVVPIFLFLAWMLARRLRETERHERLWVVEVVMLIGTAAVALGFTLTALSLLITGDVYFDLLVIATVGALTVLGALIPIALSSELRNTSRGGFYLKLGLAVPLCLVIAPISVYALTYIPMLMNGHDVNAALQLNKSAYEFHSSLEATHSYQSSWWEWPIMARPLFLFVGGDAKIYSMGNPAIFWLGLPALGFVLRQGLRNVRAKLDEATGVLSISGNLTRREASLLFVGLGYLGFWLPWAINPRALFLYHYLPALAFLILAISYCVQWLWHREEAWGRIVAMVFLAVVAVTFAYFYPHMAAVDVSRALDDSYYWFPNDVSEFINDTFLGKDIFMNWR
jgi:dolichyl-phosphate-mannose--protein O-mannosyl transferase